MGTPRRAMGGTRARRIARRPPRRDRIRWLRSGGCYPGAARTASTKKLWRDSGYGALARHAKQPRARAQDRTSALPQPDTTGHGVELGHGAAPSVARADRRPLPVHAYSGSADVHAVVAAFVLAATPASVSAGRHRSNRFLGDG
jgi:hypothetical protein